MTLPTEAATITRLKSLGISGPAISFPPYRNRLPTTSPPTVDGDGVLLPTHTTTLGRCQAQCLSSFRRRQKVAEFLLSIRIIYINYRTSGACSMHARARQTSAG